MMTPQIEFGICIIKLICLIVVATSVYKIANPVSNFSNLNKANLPHIAERSDYSFFVGSGANEAPVFRNIGSVEETNDYLTNTSKGAGENFQGAAFKNVKDITDFAKIENFAGKGL
jgi:hypothetical protein